MELKKSRVFLKNLTLDGPETEEYLKSKNSSALTQKQKAIQLLLRPNIDLFSLKSNISRVNVLHYLNFLQKLSNRQKFK